MLHCWSLVLQELFNTQGSKSIQFLDSLTDSSEEEIPAQTSGELRSDKPYNIPSLGIWINGKPPVDATFPGMQALEQG